MQCGVFGSSVLFCYTSPAQVLYCELKARKKVLKLLLCDLESFVYGVAFQELYDTQPKHHSAGTWNRLVYRGLEVGIYCCGVLS